MAAAERPLAAAAAPPLQLSIKVAARGRRPHSRRAPRRGSCPASASASASAPARGDSACPAPRRGGGLSPSALSAHTPPPPRTAVPANGLILGWKHHGAINNRGGGLRIPGRGATAEPRGRQRFGPRPTSPPQGAPGPARHTHSPPARLPAAERCWQRLLHAPFAGRLYNLPPSAPRSLYGTRGAIA